MKTEMPPEVLHYVGYARDHGGIITVVRNLAATGRMRCVLGVAPDFSSSRGPALATLALPAIAAEELGPRTFWQGRKIAAAVRAWLAEDAGRIFHGHSRAGLAVAWWLARGGERRAVASVHCYGRQRWFYRWAARQLDGRLFWLSPAMKRHYRVATEEDPWAQCIPGGVPLAGWGSRPAGDAAGVLRLGGVGALVSRKCWHLVLDAMHALPRRTRARVRFAHLGAAPAESQRYAAALRVQAAALGLEPQVEWRGARAGAQEFLREVDVLVLPSRREPLSVAMLEALAAGVPVLAANSGGARDAITPLRDGWLFRSGDPRDLARALTMLVETDARARAKPRPGPDWRFAAPVVAEQWVGVYARVTGASGARAAASAAR